MRPTNAAATPQGMSLVVVFSSIFLFICVSDKIAEAEWERSNGCNTSTESGTQEGGGEEDAPQRPCLVTSPESSQLPVIDNITTDVHQGRIDRKRAMERRIMGIQHAVWKVRLNMSAIGAQVIQGSNSDQFRTNSEALSNLTQLIRTLESSSSRDQETKMFRVFLPQCSGPPDFGSLWWNDGTSFRLYFNVDSGYRQRETKIVSSFLRLRRKPLTLKVTRAVFHSSRTNRLSTAETAVEGDPVNRAAPISLRTNRSSTGDGTRDAETAGGGVRGGRVGLGTRRGNRVRSPRTINGSSSTGNGMNLENRTLKVLVYAFNRSNRHTRHATRSVIRMMPFSRSGSEWLRINMTNVVDEWMRRPQRNLGLQIVVQEERDDHPVDLDPSEFFFSCTNDQGPAILNLFRAMDESFNQSTNDTAADTEKNCTDCIQPYLDLVTAEGGSRQEEASRTNLRDGNAASTDEVS